MKKTVLFSLLAALCIFSGWKLFHAKYPVPDVQTAKVEKDDGKEDKEDGIQAAQEQEFEQTKDIKLGYIPKARLVNAYMQLQRNKLLHASSPNGANQVDGLTWAERGPTTDVAGPYGNSRPGGGATSGRMRAIFVDLADATNKTVWVGGIDGGLWKTTDITASPATWTPVNDFFGNLAISSICQSPANNNIMYFGTGEKTFNADAVQGGGVWKSTDHGVTWSVLPSTTGFYNVSKVACDASGNVYVAGIGSGSGIQRSTDGGATWTLITPTGMSTRVPDMKISSTGRMHIVCGYYNTAALSSGYFFTDNPATVTSSTWTSPTTTFTPTQYNCELAVAGNTLYVLNSYSNFQTQQVYKSTDGGANWAATAATPPAASGTNDLSSGQGWYNLAIAVDPATPNNVVVGGLNCYRTTNGGTSWTQVSKWVGTTGVYVHADQQTAVWNGNQVLVGSDGGIFYSSDGGATFTDRNNGLRIKQFYSCAIHPSTTNYFLAGAQDNGCHAFTNAGLSSSTEVNGGDGAFVHIDQDEPQYQYTSYVYGQYHRSSDGGANWTDVNYSNSVGSFINPTDYDDANNIMYTGAASSQYVRWNNPQTGNSFTAISMAALASSVSTVKVSPFTSNRVFFGGNTGKIIKADNANQASPTFTDITGAGMTASTVSCIATGTSDNNLIATFSNYGAAHVWVNTTGAAGGWVNISGNIPDIPVRWAMFYPEDNTKAIIATEMGVYETTLINGASTVWTQDGTFPTVRTDMLKYRKSDGTVAAATHGRGLWTSSIPLTTPYIRFPINYITKPESTTGTSGCRGYTDYTVNMTIDAAPTGTATVTVSVAAGGTAVQGVDFDFTTNGNFAAPSTTLTFANGATTPQPVTIRVYDDAAVEPTESFTLNYAVSGATNAAAAPSCPGYTMSITDNDVTPVPASGSSGTYSIGVTAFPLGTSTTGNPFNDQLSSNRCQMLYQASELIAAGATAGNITTVGFTMTKNSVRAYQNFKINMGLTTLTYLYSGSSVNVISTSTYKTLASYTTVSGLNTFTLDAPFAWDGTSSVVVEVCYDNTTTAPGDFADVLNGYSDGGGSSQWNMFWQNGINCSTSYSSVTGYSSGAKPTIKFGIVPTGNPVESTLNASKTAYLGPNKDVYFYNSNGDVLARITNLSSFDYGCTQVIVDRAGTSSTAFWNNTPADYLTNKTFHVIPTTNNASGSYTITLYYSAAEKTGWETATGKSFSNIQLVKVAGQISQVTPATPNAAGTVTVVNPTVGTYGSDYTLTYSFSNGFSGFGAGIPGAALPIILTNFTGRLDNTVIPLSWSTSSEQNSSYFEVQKSVDGTNFYPLGRVTAAGNSSTQRNYGYTDKQVSEFNYYRLAMTDIDGKFVLSNVVLVKNPGVQQQAWVVNNPFTSYIDLRFAKLPQQEVKTELLTISGATVFSRVYAGSMQLRLDLGATHLAAGAYILRTTVDGKRYVNKLVKQ